MDCRGIAILFNSLIIYRMLVIDCAERETVLEKRFGVAVISTYLPRVSFIAGNTFLILAISIY